MTFKVLGELVRIANVFANSIGTAIDPAVVKFAYQVSAIGTTSTFTYGVGAVIVKGATGTYYVDIDTSASSGLYSWRWYSTGSGQAADQGSFYVRPSLT